MDEKQSGFTLYDKKPFFQLIVALLIIVLLGTLLLMTALLLGNLIFGSDWSVLTMDSSGGSDADINFLRFMMITQDIALFIIPALVILTLMKPDYRERLAGFKRPELTDIVLVVILAFSIFPITGFTGQLNAEMNLPQWLSGVEEWIVDKEDSANELLGLLIVSKSSIVLILNLVMISILPALGEELIFRGVLQKILQDIFKSGHIAIWVTAFIFSAIHIQFYGFIPRFILGLVFGYLYFWSGTLWLPVIAHFVNNAVPVIGAFIQGWDTFNVSAESDLLKQLPLLTLPLLIFTGIMVHFRKKWIVKEESQI